MRVYASVCVCVRRVVIVWAAPVCLLRLVRAADQTRLIICDETGVLRRLFPVNPFTNVARQLTPLRRPFTANQSRVSCVYIILNYYMYTLFGIMQYLQCIYPYYVY